MQNRMIGIQFIMSKMKGILYEKYSGREYQTSTPIIYFWHAVSFPAYQTRVVSIPGAVL